MSQVLSTFSATEQDRFAAYRRSTFATDAISNYVAFCLAKHSNEANKQRRKGLDLGGEDLGISSAGSDRNDALTCQKPISSVAPLSEYVAPGTASRINLIVGTISKIYAQRLVKSARSVANEKGYSNEKMILPDHVLEAHMKRLKSGVDPGFYMQPSNQNTSIGTAVSSTQFNASFLKRKMDEALAAQDAFDNAQVGPESR
jgi:hypothetical protein